MNKKALEKLRIADLLAEVPDAVVLTTDGICFVDGNDELVTLKINKTEYEDTRLVLVNFDAL